ncbi:periaxin [Struthio camelus]|uniref:periaxin n=1 Tax=Struthio camelus TaxID=8801 RepID=UPI0036040D17
MEPAPQEQVTAPELVEIVVETAAEAGVTGISLAGGGKEGIYVADVQRDSSAAKALRLREGDQLLSARVFFENIRYEDAVRLLQCAEACKVSFCLKRTVPSTDAAVRSGAAGAEAKGPKAKMARLNIKSLRPLKKKKKAAKALVAAAAVPGAKPDAGPVDVEFSLPKLSRLVRGRSAAAAVAGAAGPAPARPPAAAAAAEAKRTRLAFSRLTVREAVAGKAAALEVEEPRAKLEVALPRGGMEPGAPTSPPVSGKAPGAEGEAKLRAPRVELDVPLPSLGAPAAAGIAGARLPAVDVAAPKVDVGLSLPGAAPPAEPAPPEPGPRAPALEISVQPPALELQLPAARREPELEPGPEPGAAGMAAKVPRVALPKLGGKAGESPEPKSKGPKVKLPSLEISLPEVPEPAARAKLPAVKVPSIDISVPRATLELAPAEPPPPPPPPPPEPAKIGVPKLDLSVPGAKALAAELPKAALPAPELGIAVERPRVEVKLPAARADGESLAAEPAPVPARLSFPAVPVPALDIEVPAVAVGLELPAAREPCPRPAADSPAGTGGAGLGAVVARIPRVDIAVGKAAPEQAAAPEEAAAAKIEKGLRRLSLELEGAGADAKPKPPKVALPWLGAAGPKPRKSAEEPAESPEGGAGGAKLRMPKLGISLPKAKAGGEAEGAAGPGLHPDLDPDLSLGAGSPGQAAKLQVPKLSLPRFGSKEKASEPEAEGRAADARAKKAKFKGPWLGAAGREAAAEGRADGPRDAQGGSDPPAPDGGIKVPAVELDIGLGRVGADRLAEAAGAAETRGKMPRVELSLEGLRERRVSEGAGSPGGGGGMRMPRLDIALPRARLSEAELPLTAAGGSFPMLSLGLPKRCAAAAEPEPEPAPELALELGWGGEPAGRRGQPRFGGSSPDVRAAAAPDAPGTGAAAGGKAPSLPAGFAAAPEPAGPEGKFRLRVPALALGKTAAAAADADTQPLCPTAPGAELPFRLPHVSIPHVGFSAEGKAGRGGEPARDAGGSEAGRKMPKIRMPAVGLAGAGGEPASGQAAGKTPVLKVPELELAAPGEDVGGKEPPGADVEAGKRSRVKLPKFGIALARAGPEGGEEARMRMPSVRKAVLELVRPKGRGAEGAAGLLAEGRAEPGAGLPRGPRAGAELDGEPAGPAEAGGRLRLPKVGFSPAPAPEPGRHPAQPAATEEPRAGTLAALRSLRAPRLALGGLRRRDGQAAGSPETAEPRPSPGFKLPELGLSSRPRAAPSGGRPEPAAT